ncbi:hypothetical protein UNDKW_1388 [Undibacterium sp. KW1]|uniref:pilus assembly PilX family protein n=1 Tax=Undibacterium sp. KW1 TaxID=2058624 RepID=UPI001331E2E0|nr:PilX N-terminal domain-containing pilus assembly protein [Undibacterium sp. KW1]BBB59661.1 hypothetical protein UNDKW_1388 [Undibacterium sp. KW1]
MIRNYSSQRGFVMLTSMIFLMVLTMLAITAVRRATQEERFARSIREQNLAFQAAETALRYCQRDFELTNKGSVLPAGLDRTVNNIPINLYVQTTDDNPPPVLWATKANWATKGFRLPANTVPNVANQPECMIEAWFIPKVKDPAHPENDPVFSASGSNEGTNDLQHQTNYVITARGEGSTNLSVIWLQVTLYIGSAT